jgi:hypothetical protein
MSGSSALNARMASRYALHAGVVDIVHAGIALADYRLEADGVHVGHAGDDAGFRIRQRIQEQSYTFAVGRYVHAFAYKRCFCAFVREYGGVPGTDAVHFAFGDCLFAGHQKKLVF